MHEIPLTDVSKCWNTTLNARYDRHCVVDDKHSLSSTERACAASHLKIWKIISQLSDKHKHIDKSVDEIMNKLTLKLSTDSNKVLASIAKSDIRDFLTGNYGNLDLDTYQALQDSVDASITISEYMYEYLISCDIYKICRLGSGIMGNMPCKTLSSSKRTDEWFVILEDDVLIQNQFSINKINIKLKLLETIEKLPSDCDVCYLGGQLPLKTDYSGEFTYLYSHYLIIELNSYSWRSNWYYQK